MPFPPLRSVLPLAFVSLIILALCLLPSASFGAPPAATSVVTGRVIEVVKVVEADGSKKKEKPIADATVTLWLRSYKSSVAPLVSTRTVTTDKQGKFRAELPPGDWGIEWEARHHSRRTKINAPRWVLRSLL